MLWTDVRAKTRLDAQGDRGQATAEYALVLLGAALVALLLIAWATAGGGLSTVTLSIEPGLGAYEHPEHGEPPCMVGWRSGVTRRAVAARGAAR